MVQKVRRWCSGGSEPGCVRVLGPVALCVLRVGQRCRLRERHRPLTQSVVQPKHLRPVDELRVAVNRRRPLRYVSRRKIVWLLSSVELVLQCDLDSELGERHRAQRPKLGRDASDAGQQKVCLRQVEFRRQHERKCASRRVDLAFASDQLAHGTVCSAVDAREQHRQAGQADVPLEQVKLGDSQPGVLLAGILRLRDTRRGSAHTGFQEERGAYEVNDHGLWGYCRPRDGCETERTGAADESGSSHSTASGGGGGSGGLEEVVVEVVMVVVAPLRVGLGLLPDGLHGRAKYKCGGGVLSTRGGASNAHRSGDSRHCNMLTACGRHLVFVNGSRQRKPTD